MGKISLVDPIGRILEKSHPVVIFLSVPLVKVQIPKKSPPAVILLSVSFVKTQHSNNRLRR